LLPRQQLLGQWREICALRGNGWGKKHSTVDYVFSHPWEWLWCYHMKIYYEMKRRGYKPDSKWHHPYYRGKNCEQHKPIYDYKRMPSDNSETIYPEHNEEYLKNCLLNLKNKGVNI
jgi:uncharacterized protein (TIGR02328 family)